MTMGEYVSDRNTKTPSSSRRSIGERGFTLAGTMIGIGIGMIVTMGLIAGLSYTYKAKKEVDTKGVTQMFFDRMIYATSKSDRCTKFAQDGALRMDLNGAELPVTFEGVQEGQEIAPNIFVERMKLVRQMDVPGVASTKGVGLTKYAAKILVSLRAEGTSTPIGRERMIPLRVVTDATGLINTCAPAEDSVRLCEEFGGLVDVAAPQGEGQACKPQRHCQFGGAYSDAPLSEGGYLNTHYTTALNGGRGCPPGFDAQRAGSVGHAEKCGKTCIRMVYYNAYVCARCGVPTQSQPVGVVDAGSIVSDFDQINQAATDFDNRLTQQQQQANGITP